MFLNFGSDDVKIIFVSRTEIISFYMKIFIKQIWVFNIKELPK